MKVFRIAVFFVLTLLMVSASKTANAQQQNAPSGLGTSFAFSPVPVCSGCVQTEFGTYNAGGFFALPAVVTYAPTFVSKMDASLVINGIEVQSQDNRRTAKFSSNLDVIVRKPVLSSGGFTLGVLPRASIPLRQGSSSKLGTTLAGQYSKGANTVLVNVTGMKTFRSTTAVQGAVDYYRVIHKSGTNVFVGLQATAAKHQSPQLDSEVGLAVPYKNMQFEVNYGQLGINSHVRHQFQARIIINWGKIF